MNKELTPLKELGIFRGYDIERKLGKDFLNLYVKVKGEKLTRFSNLFFDSHNDKEYKLIDNIIYYQETYEEMNDKEIPEDRRRWEKYYVITWIGKKEEYKPSKVIIPREEWGKIEKQLKALEIIVNKEVNISWLKMSFNEFYGLETYNRCSTKKENNLYREEYNLLKEVLKDD